MPLEKIKTILAENETNRDPRIRTIVFFSGFILFLHTINTVILYTSLEEPCNECMAMVYVIIGVPIIFYLFKQDYISKLLFCISLPISLYFFTFYTGLTFGSEIVYMPFIFLTFFLMYRMWERILISILYIICYIGIVNRINIFNISSGDFELPREALVNDMIFLGCFGIIFLFCQYFFSTIKSYKSSTDKLLNDLQIKNEKLESANQELERFNYIASHDLKSPLRNISSFINLLERDINNGKSENLKEYLSFIKTGSDNMFQLIEDILKFSKIKDVSKRTKQIVSLNEICSELNMNFNNQIVVDKLPSIYESPFLIKTIFQNLIENGLKYNTSLKPTVHVSSQMTKDSLQISFKDNGIGMEKRYFNQIFEMFKRLHSKGEYEGTGIGLALVKKIIEQLGGKITVSSEINLGTEFTITLPISCLVQQSPYSHNLTTQQSTNQVII